MTQVWKAFCKEFIVKINLKPVVNNFWAIWQYGVDYLDDKNTTRATVGSFCRPKI